MPSLRMDLHLQVVHPHGMPFAAGRRLWGGMSTKYEAALVSEPMKSCETVIAESSAGTQSCSAI